MPGGYTMLEGRLRRVNKYHFSHRENSPLIAGCKLLLLNTSEGDLHFSEEHIVSHSRRVMPQSNPQFTELHISLVLQVVSVPIVVLAAAVWKLQQQYCSGNKQTRPSLVYSYVYFTVPSTAQII
jgi:hypothetical protein